MVTYAYTGCWSTAPRLKAACIVFRSCEFDYEPGSYSTILPLCFMAKKSAVASPLEAFIRSIRIGCVATTKAELTGTLMAKLWWYTR